MTVAEAWALRWRTGQAMVLVGSARVLVRHARFAAWRARLGWPGRADPAQDLRARRLARHVERAAGRLPGTSKCLPQAMALSWLLRGLRIPHRVALMARPASARGGVDDLLAMVRCGDAIILGNLPGPGIEMLVLPMIFR